MATDSKRGASPEFSLERPLASAAAVIRAIFLSPRRFYLDFSEEGPVREPAVFVALVTAVSAFLRLARSAQRTLTVASPFLNDEGLSWALALFAETPATDRQLIVRARRATRDVISSRRSEVNSLEVRVFDYAVPSPDGEGFETFHAKVVLADDATAYVGSTNMLVHGRQPLELGVILEGGPVPEIAAIVRAIRQVAQPIAPSALQEAATSIRG